MPENQEKVTRKPRALVIGLVVLVVILFALTCFFAMQRFSTPKNGSIVMSGTIGCLPKVGGGSGVYTLECAIGLKGIDGKNYELTGGSFVGMSTGTFVVMFGSLNVDQGSGKYDVAGTINISSMI